MREAREQTSRRLRASVLLGFTVEAEPLTLWRLVRRHGRIEAAEVERAGATVATQQLAASTAGRAEIRVVALSSCISHQDAS